MADITISYKNDDIAEISQSGTVTLDTAGKYCEDDITIEYVKPSGGGTDYMPENLMNTLLTYISNDVTSIRSNAFRDSNITRVTFPNCTQVNGDAFRGAHIAGFYAADFPSLEDTSSGFGNLGNYPQFACFPNVKRIGQSGLSGVGLKSIDIGGASITPDSIQGSAFLGSGQLTTLILRYPSIISLSALTAFNNTPFASGGTGGTIYIPESLYNHLGDESALDYKSATNWSVIDGYNTITWAKIEGSQYETKYADGTDIVTGGG